MGSRFKMWQEGIYMFKKAFWVPYEDSGNYPTVTKAKEARRRRLPHIAEKMGIPIRSLPTMRS